MNKLLATISILLSLLASGYALLTIHNNENLVHVFEPRFIHLEEKELAKLDSKTLSKVVKNLLEQYEFSQQLWKGVSNSFTNVIYLLITLVIIELILILIIAFKTPLGSKKDI